MVSFLSFEVFISGFSGCDFFYFMFSWVGSKVWLSWICYYEALLPRLFCAESSRASFLSKPEKSNSSLYLRRLPSDTICAPSQSLHLLFPFFLLQLSWVSLPQEHRKRSPHLADSLQKGHIAPEVSCKVLPLRANRQSQAPSLRAFSSSIF